MWVFSSSLLIFCYLKAITINAHGSIKNIFILIIQHKLFAVEVGRGGKYFCLIDYRFVKWISEKEREMMEKKADQERSGDDESKVG